MEQEMDLEGHVTSQCLVGKQQIINYVSRNDIEECEQGEGESQTHDEILEIIKAGELYTLSYFSGGHGK
ncbi:hypothetical protein LAZ67_1003716 [Cordylochernes scorpioides]|uniref:Uncharacterized protein n=1 Tax=Cordylochernes scorpioides TaxID=51811 RepID=A0ABY6JYR5_9ARAC|nr:hypothetical protein LAZ67_1003716 [Cordylochernes scorpioides]